LFFLVGAKLFQLLISFAKADGSGREAGWLQMWVW
jgi:hypothetical protein